MTLRYPHSKERSAELLRAALGRMGQHDACCNPTTYSVWYEYMAGINPHLNRALDECLRSEPRLGDASMERLHRDHVAAPDMDAVHRIGSELQRVMTGVEENAASTGEHAGAFGSQIDGLAVALKAQDSAALAPLIDSTLASAAAMKDSAQALAQQVAASRLEIEHLRADLTRARGEALLDPLTRVLNRKGFDERIEALLLQAPEAGHTHALVMIDIDHFKAVNDTHGHVLGDQVIQGLAEVLRSGLKGREHNVARYGGEEFAILLPHSGAEEALRVAEAVRLRVADMKVRDRRTQQVVLTVTVSGGVAALQAGDDAPAWVARADAALYRSKRAGRDRVTCWSESLACA